MDRGHCQLHWFIWNGPLFNSSVFYYRLEAMGFILDQTSAILNQNRLFWASILAIFTWPFFNWPLTFNRYIVNPIWKLLMMISAIYMLISTILLYFCPESPRWLMTHAPEEISKRKIIKFISLVDSNSVSEKSAEDLYEQIPKQPISTQNKRTGIVSPKILFSTRWFLLHQKTYYTTLSLDKCPV